MFESHFSKLRQEAQDLKSAAESNQAWQKRNLLMMGQTWPKSTGAEVSYFSDEYDEEHVSFGRLESEADVFMRLRNMRMTGDEKIIGVDLMGMGQTCANLGCDTTFAVTLPTPRWEADEELDKQELSERGIDVQYGDLFDPQEVDVLIQNIDTALQDKGKLGVAFFRPWGGMERYENNLYSHMYLYKYVLTPLYERLNINGVIFAELFHLPDDEFVTLVDHLINNGIWVTTVHRPRSSDSDLGVRLLKIEKPLVVEQEIPDLNK